MSGGYRQLLDATIGHLESLKQQGVHHVYASPELLNILKQPKFAPDSLSENQGEQSRSTLQVIAKPKVGNSIYDSPRLGMDDKNSAMSIIKQEILTIEKSPELLASKANLVFGSGNLEADLMLIGEAPGEEEDKAGIPFVGRAGQLLTKILSAANFDRENVYIANIVKYRPDTLGQVFGNRKPRPDEIKFWFPYLDRQIEIIQPKVIVALGATALGGLLGNMPTGITRLRGKWQSYRSVPVMPTFHPSYLLRNQSWAVKRQVWEDMLQVMERLNMPISEKQRGYFLR